MKGKVLENIEYSGKQEDIIDLVSKEDEELQKSSYINSENTNFNIESIIEFYNKKLYENKEALDYLDKVGLKNQNNYERFKLGYVDGLLLNTLSKKQKEELKKFNLLNEDEIEHFNDCITFPVFDESERVICIYGLDIKTNQFLKQIYFNSKFPLFNHKALKVYDEIILTNNILDCLSLIELGFENTVSINDFNLLNEEQIKILKNNRVKTIILCNSDELKDLFLQNDFNVKVISFPENCVSWNHAIQNNIQKNEITKLINDSEIIKPDKQDLFKVIKTDYKYTFKFSEMTYIVTGVKDIFVSNLRVNIKAGLRQAQSPNYEWYPDNLDLYSARSRLSFSNNLSNKLEIEPQIIERDLIKILEYLEYERDKRLNEDEKKEKELTEDEKELGLAFLKDKNIFNQIVDDMTTLGYVGEDLNKKLLYLCASSRKLDNPISILLISQSASGKSYLVETVRKLIPHEEVIAITSLSDQALNYLTDMSHKFLIFGEAIHSDTIEYQIREMLSSKELTRLVTLKDDKTGKLKSELIKKKVIVSTVMSTTTHNINPENASRYFIVNADESKIQTQKIHESQKLKYTLERQYIKDVVIPMIIKKHQIAQRLLKKVTIINNFARYLNFPDSTMRTRRDHERFIDLITAVCFLRQYQKEIKTYNFSNNDNEDKRIIEYIECDLDDYRIAYEIMINGIMSATMTDIPKGAISLYEEIRNMIKEQAVERQLFPEEITFIQRDVREYTKLGADSIRKYMKILVDYEYLLLISGRNKGLRQTYRLRKDESIDNLDLTIIPTPEEIQEKMKNEIKLETNVNTILINSTNSQEELGIT